MSMDVGSKGVKSDINVTPLVDVVLVLLIIFMVITPLLQRGKPVELPRARHVSALEGGGDPILLSVTKDGRIWIDKKEVARQALAEGLAAELAAAPGAPVVLQADRDLDYRTIRAVILEVAKTRVPGLSLAAAQLPERP